MSFLYPRTIAILRENAQTGVGAIGYGGTTEQGTTVIASGLPANIAQKRQRQAMRANVPVDAPDRAGWTVTIPSGYIDDPTTVKERDIVVDDIGKMYIVIASEPHGLGWRLIVETLQA